jgi:hypothetical protein
LQFPREISRFLIHFADCIRLLDTSFDTCAAACRQKRHPPSLPAGVSGTAYPLLPGGRAMTDSSSRTAVRKPRPDFPRFPYATGC